MLTVTISLVDRNIEVDRLVFEDRAYILKRSDSAGGRHERIARTAFLRSEDAGHCHLGRRERPAPGKKLAAKSGFGEDRSDSQRDRVNLTITDKQGLATVG